MADFPALPLWTDAYLADTTHLSHAEHGRYLLMLIHIWRMPNKKFPNDDAWLSRKFGCSEEDIRELFRPLISEFFKSTGNWLYQKRILREFKRVTATRERASARRKCRETKEKAPNSVCTTGPVEQPEPEPEPESKKDKPPSIEGPPLIEASPSAQPTEMDRSRAVHASHGKPKDADRGGPSSRGCRIPDDWRPTSADVEYAASQGCTEAETERIALDFSQYWRAKAGKDAVKRDWHATWQRWVRTERDGTFKRGNGNGNGEENTREWLVRQAIEGPFGPMAVHSHGTYSSSTGRDIDIIEGKGVPLLRSPKGIH